MTFRIATAAVALVLAGCGASQTTPEEPRRVEPTRRAAPRAERPRSDCDVLADQCNPGSSCGAEAGPRSESCRQLCDCNSGEEWECEEVCQGGGAAGGLATP